MYLRQSRRLESCEPLKAVIRYLEPGNVALVNRNPVNPVAFIRETPCDLRIPRTFFRASKKAYADHTEYAEYYGISEIRADSGLNSPKCQTLRVARHNRGITPGICLRWNPRNSAWSALFRVRFFCGTSPRLHDRNFGRSRKQRTVFTRQSRMDLSSR